MAKSGGYKGHYGLFGGIIHTILHHLKRYDFINPTILSSILITLL